MSTDLILIKGEVPAHILAASAARIANEDAMFGISAGRVPSLRTKNGRFRLLDAAGEETIVQAKELEDAKYLSVVVLGAKRELNKAYYDKPFDPNQDEVSKPTCYSVNATTPASDAQDPQCNNCASCPHNVFGSGRNAAGQATKGKACSDMKILAVYYKGGIYELSLKPASLKNWGAYVQALNQRNIPIGHVKTFISFDENSDYSVLMFAAGEYIPEEKLPAVAAKAADPLVEQICKSVGVTAPRAELPKPQPAPAPEAKPAAKPRVVKDAPMVEVPVSLPSDSEIDDILDL